MNPIGATPGVMQIATGAIRKSVDNLARDAHAVANSTDVMSRDTMEALIDAKQQVLYTKAAARMIGTADAMMGTLLDIRG
jgi:hypothetical protein